MIKYSLILITSAFFLFAVGSASVAKQLEITAPINPSVNDTIIITVTANGIPIKSAVVSFDNGFIGITNKTGKLDYTLTAIGLHNIKATKTGYGEAVKLIKVLEPVDNKLVIRCLNDSIVVARNIVIVIDTSGSTSIGDPITGLSYINHIKANAISIVRAAGLEDKVGIVSFGRAIVKTDLVPLDRMMNRAELEMFIKSRDPEGEDSSTNLIEGLLAARGLLDSSDGRKEIIVISDGLIPNNNFEQLIRTVMDLEGEGIKVHLVQVLLSYTYNPVGNVNRLYNELASASSDGRVIILNPSDEASTFVSAAIYKELLDEPCSIGMDEPIIITVTLSDGTPIEGAVVSFDGSDIGNTSLTGKLSFSTLKTGLHNITANKLGYESAVKTLQVLPILTINPTPTVTSAISPAQIKEPQSKFDIKEAKEPINKIEAFKSNQSWLSSIIDWLKSIF